MRSFKGKSDKYAWRVVAGYEHYELGEDGALTVSLRQGYVRRPRDASQPALVLRLRCLQGFTNYAISI
jgi:hypothetical protein